jgi:hypothetical protein
MEPWDIEAAYHVNRGIDPDSARVYVAMWWMVWGDFRPLAAMIRTGEVIDDAILDVLAQLIEEGRLKLTPKRRGRPKSPSARARDILAGHLHETKQGSPAEIADALKVSEPSVRRAVTAWRKRGNKKAPI